MVAVAIQGQTYEIAPYKLGAMRQAAPHIDAINAQGEIESIADMMELAAELVAVLAIGLVKVDPQLTEANLLDRVGPEDMPALYAALNELLVESGLTPKGEAMAPSAPGAEGASPSNSETSSTN